MSRVVLTDADMPLQYQLPDDMSHAAINSHGKPASIDRRRDRYPFCIVWGPLPLISWLLPFIGHMGICDSEGKVHDFAGPYHIGLDRFMVPVTRFLPIDTSLLPPSSSSSPVSPTSPTAVAQRWDAGIDIADAHFSQQMHNICVNNCHHHTAMALQSMGLGAGYATQTQLAGRMLLYGRWKSGAAMACTVAPFVVIVLIVVLATVFTR